MFDPSNVSISSNRKSFRDAFGNFMANFTVVITKDGNEIYILKTGNSVEKDFYKMEKEANEIIYDPSDADFVHKTYERKDFLACVEEAERCGFYLSIPDHL